MNPLKLLTSLALVEWATAALVFVSGLTVGHAAQSGLNATQWTGGVAAILGSVTLAVLVRIEPKKAAAKR